MNGDTSAQGGTSGKRRSFDELYQQYVEPNLSPAAAAYLQGRPKAQRKQAQGFLKEETFPRQVSRQQTVRQMGGYGAASTAQQDATLGELATYQAGGTPVNFRREGVDYQAGGTPLLAQLSQYTRERLGSGLTPQEEAVIRGKGVEAVGTSAAESQRQLANTAAARGIDPRGALAAMGEVERQRQQGRTDVERGITEADLARKQQIEQLAEQTGQLGEQTREFDVGTSEGARRFDVGADLQRRAQIDAVLGHLGELGENRYQYDTGFVEARRQAKMNRLLLEHLSRKAQPGGLETAGAILGGIRGGLSMGG
jgi:hypothetical protein